MNTEQDHYEKCPTCGKLIDMRDLGQVFSHGWMNKETGKYECSDEEIVVPFSSSKKVGDSVQYFKNGMTENLN